jgi:hypothetical protein
MRRSILIPALLLSACGSAHEDGRALDPRVEAPRPADTAGLVPTLAPAAMPSLRLLAFHDADGVLDSIRVFRAERRVQTLVSDGGDPSEHPEADVDTVDINFDGYPDVQQQVVWGATGNAAYAFWLFDRDSSRFVAAPEFGEKIQAYGLDRARREITVRSNGGHAGLIHELDVYRPEGRGLVRLRSEHQDWIAESGRYVRRRGSLEGDRWVERVDTLAPEAAMAAVDSSG